MSWSDDEIAEAASHREMMMEKSERMEAKYGLPEPQIHLSAELELVFKEILKRADDDKLDDFRQNLADPEYIAIWAKAAGWYIDVEKARRRKPVPAEAA